MKTRVVWAVLTLLAFGLVRAPWERSIERELKDQHFRAGEVMRESMREQLGQLGFAAALGGFRSFLATVLSIKATNAWSNVKWDELESDYNLITQLQPRVTHYWDMAHWHLAFNARKHYLEFDDTRPRFERERLAEKALERAKKFLSDGLRYNPDSFMLTERFAFLYGRKHDPAHPPNPCLAAEWYRKAAEKPHAPPRALRFSGFFLADCPGREREAYDLLISFYRAGERYPTLIEKLKRLEVQLAIMESERIPDAAPLRPARRGAR